VFLFAMKRCCPDCQSRNVRRSVRRGILEIVGLSLILMRPFRCERCDTRYYGLVFAGRSKGETPRKRIDSALVKI